MRVNTTKQRNQGLVLCGLLEESVMVRSGMIVTYIRHVTDCLAGEDKNTVKDVKPVAPLDMVHLPIL